MSKELTARLSKNTDSKTQILQSSTGPFQSLKALKQNLNKNAEWKQVQNARYAAFVEHNLKKMKGKLHSQLWRVYQSMAAFVMTRNFRQCQSKHQKMLTQVESIQDIARMLAEGNPGFMNMVEDEKARLVWLPSQELRAPLNEKKELQTTDLIPLSQSNLECISKLPQNQDNLFKWTFRLKNSTLPTFLFA